MQTKVLLAEDALLAFIDRAHPKHLHAGAFFRYFAQEEYILYSNISIIMGTYQKILDTLGTSVGKEFLKALSFSNIVILSPENSEIKTAIKIVLGTSDLSFSEGLMLVMSERRNIEYICTFTPLHHLFGIEAFYLPV